MHGLRACTEKCPSKKTPDAFNEFTGPTTAITIAFPQAIPKKAVINAAHCRQFVKGKCGVCEFHKVCGGCRARAWSMDGDYMGEEPLCTYQPRKAKEAE